VWRERLESAQDADIDGGAPETRVSLKASGVRCVGRGVPW